MQYEGIEIFKPVPGFDNYIISNWGVVKSLGFDKSHPGRVLKGQPNSKNYLRVYLTNRNGKKERFFIHRLQAIAFIPNPYNLPYINHKDENPQNNFIYVNPDGTIDFEKSNLEFCDAKYNSNFGTRNERISKMKKGLLLNYDKFSKVVLQYSLEGILIAEHPSLNEAHRQTSIALSDICRCCQGLRKSAGGFIWKYKE